jgi:hypothetical protein
VVPRRLADGLCQAKSNSHATPPMRLIGVDYA